MIVAFLDRADNLHELAVRKIRSLKNEIFATLNLFLSEAWSVIARRCREKKKDWKEPLSILRQFESSLEIIWVEDLKDKHAKIVDEIIKNNEELNYNDVVPVEVLKERGMRLLTLDRALERYVKEAARKRL
ncbi:MAG: hypothetical protein QXP38_09500 [Nitrososphaerota archaeon]